MNIEKKWKVACQGAVSSEDDAKQAMNDRKRTAASKKKQSSIFNLQSSILYYHLCPTALGHAGILFQTDPFFLKGVFLPRSRKSDLLERMKEDGPAKPARAKEALVICKEIQAYFEGSPVKTPWELLDLSELTPLQYMVLKAAATVRYGEVRSYGQIAAQVGRPQACRFVGTTLSRNPFPIFIPCHRIVRADGSPGGFSGGTDLKRRMLLLEK
ncbi:MAG: MGMT family protein [Deltaproteobacteria bacterium]|nr:MGMT family protein [Deltaproteobacteria bacterium]